MRTVLTFLLTAAAVFAQDGKAIYEARCAACHDAPTGRVPPFSALRAMSPPKIMQALESGPMKAQAAELTAADRYALVTYLATPAPKAAVLLPASAFCPAKSQPSPDSPDAPSWSGWGVDAANTRYQNAKAAGITAAGVPGLKLKWAFGLGDGTAVRSQPAVGDGSIFTADLTNSVYSLDARSGCIHWVFRADATVRGGIVLGTAGDSSTRPAIYFGDSQANVYAVDASAGKLLWKAHVAEHFAALITGAPLLHDGTLYVPVSSYEEVLPGSPTYECCTFRGSVVALDAATGKHIWTTYTIAQPSEPTEKSKTGTQLRGPSGGAVWSTPTFDERLNRLYISTGDNYSDPSTATSDAVLALDAHTGKLLWSRQVTPDDVYNYGAKIAGRDFDFGQPPILVSLPQDHRALVIGQKSGLATAFDPDRQGKTLWQTRVGKGGSLGGIQWGSAADSENMYVALSDIGFAPVADKSSPGGYRLALNPTQGGGLFALRLATGEKAWSAPPVSCGERKQCSPAQSAAVSAIPGVIFSGGLDGHLRAYSAATGEIVWDVDTAGEYEAVNGQKANGGALDVAGPVIAGGMLYVNSGYGQWGGKPGNVLLAFSVGGK